MSFIAWSQEMSVGVVSIDTQHKKLIAMLNELYDASAQGKGTEIIGHTLEGLVQYTIEHFAYEERLFKETNYPETEEHIKEHNDLAKRLEEIREKFRQGLLTTVPEETQLFLVKWLLDHTLGSDQKYSQHFIKAGIQ